jgi:cytochrome c oxidase cbb3-type subunit 3
VTRKRDELLDHAADGIQEFDNDLPRWWLYGFYFTILLAAAYWVNFHVLPEPLVGEPTVVAEYEADVRRAGPRPSAPAPAPAGGAAVVAALTSEADLAKGRAIYESETHPCSACHRPDLGGLVGPNLTDDRWLHGCAIGDLVRSIQTGYPTLGMLPYGGGPPLTDEQLLQLASYVASRAGTTPPGPKASDPARDKPCSPTA